MTSVVAAARRTLDQWGMEAVFVGLIIAQLAYGPIQPRNLALLFEDRGARPVHVATRVQHVPMVMPVTASVDVRCREAARRAAAEARASARAVRAAARSARVTRQRVVVAATDVVRF